MYLFRELKSEDLVFNFNDLEKLEPENYVKVKAKSEEIYLEWCYQNNKEAEKIETEMFYNRLLLLSKMDYEEFETTYYVNILQKAQNEIVNQWEKFVYKYAEDLGIVLEKGNENKMERITTVLEIHTNLIKEVEPTFLVSFERKQNNVDIIREKIRITNVNSNIRYYGETPAVFIRREKENDKQHLEFAKQIKEICENENITKMNDLKNEITKQLEILKTKVIVLTYYQEIGDIKLQRPNPAFITFTNKLYEIGSENNE